MDQKKCAAIPLNMHVSSDAILLMLKTYVSTIQGSIRTFFIEKSQARTPERCLLKSKMCHSKWYHKICIQTFSYRFIVSVKLDEKSNFSVVVVVVVVVVVLIHFCRPSNIDYRKR